MYFLITVALICHGLAHACEYTACILSLAVFTQITCIPVCHHSSCPHNQNVLSMVTALTATPPPPFHPPFVIPHCVIAIIDDT